MKEDLQKMVDKLHEAKQQRGRLSQIAADSGVSYRTIYGLMHTESPVASARTFDKLAAYFKKVERRIAKEAV